MGKYLDGKKPMGENVRKLMIEWAAADAVHTGDGTPLGNALSSLQNPAGLSVLFREALEKVEQALATIKALPDNPYGDDEAIAGEILRRLKERDDAIRKRR